MIAFGDGGERSMVEPVSLTVGAIAAALVAKASDKAAERAVDDGAGALARLVGWLRARFAHDDATEASTAFAKVEDAPDSPSRVRELAAQLDRWADDPGFRAELQGLVDKAQAAGVDVSSIAQSAWGNQNTQIAGVVGSSITTTYGQAPAPPGL